MPFNEEILDGKKIAITVKKISEVPFEIEFSPSRFVVIIDNLISNSINARASHINVVLNVPDNKTLEIKVRDDGRGIKDQYLEKIFDYGFSTRGGSGIGLYHVKKIMKKYGTITVNNHLKKGVEFILEIKK